jgi:hypothetical protein
MIPAQCPQLVIQPRYLPSSQTGFLNEANQGYLMFWGLYDQSSATFERKDYAKSEGLIHLNILGAKVKPSKERKYDDNG